MAACDDNVTTIKCKSKGQKYTECQIDESRIIVGARVTRQISKSDCGFYNGTLPSSYSGGGKYGFIDNVLWVHGGCRAKFEICFTCKLALLLLVVTAK